LLKLVFIFVNVQAGILKRKERSTAKCLRQGKSEELGTNR
jgi:hypothetical protein